MTRRLLAVLGVLAAAFVLVGVRAEERLPVKIDKKAGEKRFDEADPKVRIDDAANQQERLKRQFDDFKQALLGLAQRMENSAKQEDRDKAKVLREAIKKASEEGVDTKFSSLIEALRQNNVFKNTEQLQTVLEQNEELRKNIREIMELLLKDDRDKQLREERLRVQRLLEELNRIIRKQELHQNQVVIGRAPNKDLARKQGDITRQTKNLIEPKANKGNEAKHGEGKDSKSGKKGIGEGKDDTKDPKGESRNKGEGKDGKTGEGKDSKSGEGKDAKPGEGKDAKDGKDGTPGEGAGKEGKEGEGKDSKSGEGKDGKPGEGKDGKGGEGKEGKPGEGKEGKASEGKDGKPGEGKQGKPGEGKDGKPGEGKGKPGDGKPSDKPSTPKPGSGKPGEGKPGAGKPGQPKQGDSKGKGEGKGESKGGKPGEGKPGQGSGKPGEGKPSKGQGGQGGQGQPKPGESKPGGGGSKGGQQPPQPPPDSGQIKKQIQDANKYQEKAENDLRKDNRHDAADNEEEARKQLEIARKKLEDLLRQLREEEIERLLARLEARCRHMLAMQIEVRNGTVELDKTIKANADGKPTRADQQQSNVWSDKEDEIVKEATAGLRLLEAEGSAVAFAEVFQQVRGDMQTVAARLRKTDTGVVTVTIENQIIETLQEMVEALKKAIADNKNKSKPSQGGGGQPPDPKLIDLLAELKMIRSMQKRVNDRTELYGKQYKGEQAPPAEQGSTAEEREKYDRIQRELKDLSVRQQKIGKVTHDIATGKSEAK